MGGGAEHAAPRLINTGAHIGGHVHVQKPCLELRVSRAQKNWRVRNTCSLRELQHMHSYTGCDVAPFCFVTKPDMLPDDF